MAGTINYGYQANGLMTSLQQAGQTCTYGYDLSGMIWYRSSPWRYWTVYGRWLNGMIEQDTDWVGPTEVFIETLSPTPDSRVASYTSQRGGLGAWTYQGVYNYNSRNQLIHPVRYCGCRRGLGELALSGRQGLLEFVLLSHGAGKTVAWNSSLGPALTP